MNNASEARPSEPRTGQDRLASGGEKEGGNGVVIGRRVMTHPVVESGVRNALLLGILPLGRLIGIGEVVEGGSDVRPWPTVRVWAERVRVSKLIGGHGSFSVEWSLGRATLRKRALLIQSHSPWLLGRPQTIRCNPLLGRKWLTRRTQLARRPGRG